MYCSKVIPRNEFTNKSILYYIGLTESSLKDRLYKHKNFFKYKSKRNLTELPNFISEEEKH